MKILVVRKMSALEYHYNGNHQSKEIIDSHNEQAENISKIEKILNDSNHEYKTVTRKELSKRLVNEHDLVISAGGDGTVIAAAAYNRDILQLNLKTDRKSRGTLCQENIEKALDCILNKNYNIEKWARQDVYLDGELIGRALNETCIGENLKFSKMAKYGIVFFQDRLVEFPEIPQLCRNSGLIIATGTGSTGWPAAFEPFPKNSQFLKYKTILPYGGNAEGESQYFGVKYKGHEGKFAIDTVEYDLPRDSVLEVKVSKNPLRVIIPKEEK
jgi:NAD kinase